jgi:23S rRNA-/tRNA-specific pseudouridylate synthase
VAADRPDLLLGADAARLYVWKPAGLPVFPPHADPAGDCVLARVLARWPGRAIGWPPGFEGGIAHRLDTATSGLLVLARAPEDLAPLRAAFAERSLRKHYVFRSAGSAPAQVVEIPLAHHPRRADRMVAARPTGRTSHRGRWYDAWTRFAPLTPGWWAAEMRTGVMHQIRVHAASIGLPLDGDVLYGGAPGAFVLHHVRMEGPGWASPEAPLPPEVGFPG